MQFLTVHKKTPTNQKCSSVEHDWAMASPTCFQTNPDDRKLLVQERKSLIQKCSISFWEQLQHVFLLNQKMSHIFKQRIFSDYLALNVI